MDKQYHKNHMNEVMKPIFVFRFAKSPDCNRKAISIWSDGVLWNIALKQNSTISLAREQCREHVCRLLCHVWKRDQRNVVDLIHRYKCPSLFEKIVYHELFCCWNENILFHWFFYYGIVQPISGNWIWFVLNFKLNSIAFSRTYLTYQYYVYLFYSL